MQLILDRLNTDLADNVVGLNTLRLCASIDPLPDIMPMAATPNDERIVNIPGPLG